MRRLKRNQTSYTYYLYTGMTDAVDSDGYKTGRKVETYADGVNAKGCIVFKGSSSFKAYGVDEEFSGCIIPDTPINVTTQTKLVINGDTYYVKSHPTTMNEQRIYFK